MDLQLWRPPPAPGQRLGRLPCAASRPCAAPRRGQPRRQGLPARRQRPLAATAAAADSREDPLAAGSLEAGGPGSRLAEEILLEPVLPEEQGAAAAYPGGSVDELGRQDVLTWQHRMHEAVRPVVASLQQQTLVLMLAEIMQCSLEAEQGAAAEAAPPAMDQRQFLEHAAVLERCCERLRCAWLPDPTVQQHEPPLGLAVCMAWPPSLRPPLRCCTVPLSRLT